MALEFNGTWNHDTCIFLPTIKEVWESIQQTYLKVKDAAQIYELNIKMTSTKQGNKTITEYVNILKGLWQEMDHYRVIDMKNSDDAEC